MGPNSTIVFELKQEIAAAFADVQKPVAAPVYQEHVSDEYTETDWTEYFLRTEVASLTVDFWEKSLYKLSRLSDQAYQAILPGLLIAALENEELLDSAIWNLNASFNSIYMLGRDPNFDYQTGLFTHRQHFAVCSFLQYCAKLYPHRPQKFWINRMGYWTWNKVSHPFVDYCRDFFESMRNYDYPPLEKIATPESWYLVDQIRTAFRDVPYPGDYLVGSSDPGPDEDIGEFGLAFRGTNWMNIHPDLTAQYYDALCFFTPAATHYFLPAFMVSAVLGAEVIPGYWSNATPEYHLPIGDNRELYNEEQMEAVAAFKKLSAQYEY